MAPVSGKYSFEVTGTKVKDKKVLLQPKVNSKPLKSEAECQGCDIHGSDFTLKFKIDMERNDRLAIAFLDSTKRNVVYSEKGPLVFSGEKLIE